MLNNPVLNAAVTLSRVATASLHFGPDPGPSQQTLTWQINLDFIAMLNAYRPSGGLARANEVAARLRPRGGTSVNALAQWIVTRQVISFEWQGKIWLPLFQFNAEDMARQPGLNTVLSELVLVYDDWHIAKWFSLPNPWLADCTPADTLASNAPEVLNAARAERFVATG